MKIVALVPAYQEAESIATTIEGLLNQERVPDQIVVVPNGCTDDTAEIARSYPVTVMELPALKHQKSEALNLAWLKFAKDADVVICIDADTYLPPNAVGDWEKEMLADGKLGGSSSKFTMLGGDLLTRLQRAEFSRWTAKSLRRGWTSVLAGTGCAIRNDVLHEIVFLTDRPGPWSYNSQTEDFELTYQIRKLGYSCSVSPTVRAYTDSMKTIKSLWNQRMKWSVGTVEDLFNIGYNKYTRIDWLQQAAGLFMALFRVAWFVIIGLLIFQNAMVFTWYWIVIPPVIFIAADVKASLLIPHKDWKDIAVAASLIPQELFSWLRAGWFVASWMAVFRTHITGHRKNRWDLQIKSESSKL